MICCPRCDRWLSWWVVVMAATGVHLVIVGVFALVHGWVP